MIMLFCFSCSSSKPEVTINEKSNEFDNNENNKESKNLFIDSAEPFYPIKETVEDIQTQVNELRSRMIDYEERIASPNLNNISQIVKIPQLKNEDFTIIGAELDGISISKFSPPKKWALAFGNEAHGLSSHIKSLLDKSITISKLGNIESLNVAVASGVILERLTRS